MVKISRNPEDFVSAEASLPVVYICHSSSYAVYLTLLGGSLACTNVSGLFLYIRESHTECIGEAVA